MTRFRFPLRFSLRTLFVFVTICGTGGYWLACKAAAEREREAYQSAAFGWEIDSLPISAEDLCKASLRVFEAEAAVPFGDHRKAALTHLERVERIRLLLYGPTGEWMQGIKGDAAYAEALARKAKIERYCAEAERIVAESR